MEKYIRISASYLFNISFTDSNGDERFLLIESERRKGKYQPIGGCYKFYARAKKYLQSLGCKFENSSNGVDSISDLRLLIPENNLEDFITWYLSEKDRETSFERELNEELIDNLPEKSKHIFSSLKMSLIKKDEDFKPFFDDEKNILSIKPMDIVKIELTKKQKDCLLSLCEKCSDKFIFASFDDILKGQKEYSDGKIAIISPHTKKTLCPEESDYLSKS